MNPNISEVEQPFAIFDLDGTVWHSAPGIYHSFRHTLDHFGLPCPDDDDLMVHLGPPLLTSLAELGIAATDLERARTVYRAEYLAAGESMCSLYDGIVDLLDDLRERGYRLATATSKGVEPARRMLEQFDLTKRFDAVAAASMTATGHTKVEVIGDALNQLHNPPPHWGFMIGDRVFDIDGGKHFGLETIGVAWGYAQPGELAAAGPTHSTTRISDLAQILRSRQG